MSRRRIEFVILRTASSPPVALHPASQRRSYLQLQGLGLPWHGLSPCWCRAFTGALISGHDRKSGPTRHLRPRPEIHGAVDPRIREDDSHRRPLPVTSPVAVMTRPLRIRVAVAGWLMAILRPGAGSAGRSRPGCCSAPLTRAPRRPAPADPAPLPSAWRKNHQSVCRS